MPRWPMMFLLLVPLAGCVADTGPDVEAYDGPYYDDGGAYGDDYDVVYQQRAVYGRTYYYPPPYYGGGYFYGGGRYYRRGDRDDAPRRDRDPAARGESGRERTRGGEDRPAERSRAAPTRPGGDPPARERTRATPNRSSESVARPSPTPAAPRGSPRGGGGRR